MAELSEVEHVKAVLRSAERDYQHRIKELQSTLAERDKRIRELEAERRCILFQTREQWARRARNAEARERELLAMHHEDQARIVRLEGEG